MIAMVSSPCQAAGEEANAGDHDPGFGAGDGGFEVFGKAAIASEPGKGALDHPTTRFRLEGSDSLLSGHDLDRPLAQVSEGIEQLLATIDAIGKDVTQLGKTTIVPGRSDSASGVSITRDSHDRIHISYYDAVDTVLMHATNASGAWATEIMDNWAYTGLVSSIAVDPHDHIHVAYSYLAPDGNYYLTYATLVGDTWWSWTLDNVGIMGFYCSITADSNDRPHISYWDGNFSNQGLKYATAE